MYSILVGDSGDEFVTGKSVRDVNVTLHSPLLFGLIGAYLGIGLSGTSADRLCSWRRQACPVHFGLVGGAGNSAPDLFVDHCDRSGPCP